MTLELRINVFDRYNWDEGKHTNIGGVEIPDTLLGRLHKVGLAREYEVRGQSKVFVRKWKYSREQLPNTTTASAPAPSNSKTNEEPPKK